MRYTAALLVLIFMLVAAAAVHFVANYYDSLAFRYAQRFELPRYTDRRAEPSVLSGGRVSNAKELRALSLEHLAGIEFKPYSDRAPSLPQNVIRKIDSEGYALRGNPAWRPMQPFDWANDPNSDRNWRFRLNALDPLEAYLAYYDETGDEESFATIKYAVFDWIDYNLVRAEENDFKWYDMSTGIRATRLAFLFYFGVLEGKLSDSELNVLLAVMDLHVEALTNPRLLNRGNHGLFQMLGLASICHVAQVLASCDQGASYARETFGRVARDQFTAEGMHAEHSSQYHPWIIQTIENMLEYGYFRSFDASFLDAAKANVVHYFYPDGSMTLLGDTGEQHVCSIREMHPYAEYMCTEGESGHFPEETSLAMPESGYAIVRGPWSERPLKNQSYFFLNAAYHSQAHKQSDDFSVLWFEKGMPILVDSGKHSYDRSKWREYMLSTRAHNTVEIDGKDYPRSRHEAYGSALKAFDQVGEDWLMHAEVFRKTLGVNHKRIVAVRPGQYLFVIDVLEGQREDHDFRQWFHFHESLEVLESGRIFKASNMNEGAIGSFALYANTGNTSQLVKGQEHPQLQGWISRRYRQLSPNYALSNEASGQKVVLAAGFSVLEFDSPLVVGQEGSGLWFCFGGAEGVRVDIRLNDLSYVPCATELRTE